MMRRKNKYGVQTVASVAFDMARELRYAGEQKYCLQ